MLFIRSLQGHNSWLYNCKLSISSIEALLDNFLEKYKTKDHAYPTLDIDFQEEAFFKYEKYHEEEEDPFLGHQDEIIDEGIKGYFEWECDKDFDLEGSLKCRVEYSPIISRILSLTLYISRTLRKMTTLTPWELTLVITCILKKGSGRSWAIILTRTLSMIPMMISIKTLFFPTFSMILEVYLSHSWILLSFLDVQSLMIMSLGHFSLLNMIARKRNLLVVILHVCHLFILLIVFLKTPWSITPLQIFLRSAWAWSLISPCLGLREWSSRSILIHVLPLSPWSLWVIRGWIIFLPPTLVS